MTPFLEHHDFLEPDMLNELFEFAVANEDKFKPTVLARQRRDTSFRVSLGLRGFGPVEGVLRERVGAALPQWIVELKVNPFNCSRIELELVAHGDGAFFKPHIDTLRGIHDEDKSMRVISAVYYFHSLPKAFGGGALRLFRFGDGNGRGDFVDIEPESNTLLVFPSWAPHEVRPVSCPSRRFSDSRFAVNCWLHR